MSAIKLGALCWSQHSDWPSLREAGRRADRLGYDTLWTWDHLYPIVGAVEGPIFEGWTVAAAWSESTTQIRIGLLVGANTFREPALTAKMVTTLDHLSGGRAILGIGGAWFEPEHEAFGVAFGDGPPERLRWLGEALPVIRGMLRGERPTAAGPRYRARAVRNDPAPLQEHLPILIGGGGERVTLRLVARYGDACNLGGDVETLRRKDLILRQHCEEVGRDEREIERTAEIFCVVIRDSRTEAERVFDGLFEHNGGAEPWTDHRRLVGTPEDVAARLAPIVELGYHHLIASFPAPYDEESMERLVGEVKPALERLVPQVGGKVSSRG
jgi:alkanesulfonate monooxygenase SsuD/methylene tetrahydromethanopterin reductase-like flavin-dependent oxidoreductase (luciferase family)